MIECYNYDGIWWYRTPKGAMCCPPHIRKWPEVEAYFKGYAVKQIDYRPDEDVKIPYTARRIHRHKCIQYDKDMNVVATYASVRAAAEGSGLSTTSVRSCMSGKADFVKGKTFRKM